MRSRLALALVLTALCASASLAQEGCSYVSGIGQGVVRFTDGAAIMEDPSGNGADCTLEWGDEAGGIITCTGYPETHFSLASASLNGQDQEEILLLWDHLWYRQCG